MMCNKFMELEGGGHQLSVEMNWPVWIEIWASSYAWQDMFYEGVGSSKGMSHIGPTHGQQRLG